MKKVIIKRYLRVAVLVILGLFLLSYGNTKNHPTINSFMLRSFIAASKTEVLQDPKLKNYKFDFEKPRLKGNFITESGLLNPSELNNFRGDQFSNLELIGVNSTYTEKERTLSPREWIEHGGFSADVPEVPASLRHFYDPTQGTGKQHLTDTVNSKIMSLFQSMFPNPNTNGVDWALGSEGNYGVLEHTYTWEHGKKYIKGALEESDTEKRKIYMARAWRSLGETLHMIADNGCPPHVRNDGHPSIPNKLFAVFGNPDPYEEILDPNSLDLFQWGEVPPKLGIKFENAKTARKIAHDLAVFTNENFVTQETISGTDRFGRKIKQITHPKYEYKSPKISKESFENGYYQKKIEGISEKVLMCSDKGFFSKHNIYKSYPEVTKECVYSQAKVLIPTIKMAGAYVIKLYIPKLEVIISEAREDGTITGEIIHTMDQEYKEKIYYNGPIEIKRNEDSKLTSFNAKNGKFSGKIEVKEKTFATAEIEFGGITVQSDEFEINVKKEENIIEEIDVQKDETKEKSWVLKEIIVEDRKKQIDEKNKIVSNKKYEIKHLQNSSYSKVSRGDEIFEVQFKWTDPPKIIEPNTAVSLFIKGTTIANTVRRNDFYCFAIDLKAGATAYLTNETNEKYLWSSGIRDINGIEMMYLSCDAQYPTWDEKFYLKKFPQGKENDTLTIIIAISNCGSFNEVFTQYTYEWE